MRTNRFVFHCFYISGIVFTIKGVYEMWAVSGADETDHGNVSYRDF